MSEALEAEEIPDGFRQTQLGPRTITVPEHWDRVRVKDVSEVVTRGKQPTYVDDPGVPVLNQSCIYWDGYYPENLKYLDEDVAEDWKSKHFASKGDILINSTGQGTLGRALYWDKKSGTHAIDSHITRVSVDSDTIDPEFLRYYLESTWGQTMLYVFCVAGSTGQIELSKTDLLSMPLLSPPVDEQRRIADILSTVDEQIQQTDEMIEKTKELKQGLMQDLLIQGLSSGSTQEVQIGPRTLQIPAHWDMEPCGQLFEAINGRAFKPEEWEEEGTQIIRIQDLRPGADAETNYANFEVDDKYHVTDGDLLFCWAGNINTSLGAYIWSGDDAYLNQHIYNLRPKKELNKRFFAFSLNQHLRLLKTMVGGSAGQVHITKGDFEAFKLPVPPVEEQERIGDIIGCVQKKMDEQKGRREDLHDLKRGLMQDLLTGKVRINTD